jgi:hypothetical protein
MGSLCITKKNRPKGLKGRSTFYSIDNLTIRQFENLTFRHFVIQQVGVRQLIIRHRSVEPCVQYRAFSYLGYGHGPWRHVAITRDTKVYIWLFLHFFETTNDFLVYVSKVYNT